jgi:flagellar basal body-associated protein FliL
MKKGLINIILVVLALTNIVLSAIIVFAVVPAMNSTTDLVSKVANAIDLEKEGQNQLADGLSIDSISTFTFTDNLLVSLKAGDDAKSHYASFKLTLTLNKDDESYSKYISKLKDNEELMKSEVNKIVSKYTKYEVENNQEAILEEIVGSLRKLFNDTTFIYSAGFNNLVTQ